MLGTHRCSAIARYNASQLGLVQYEDYYRGVRVVPFILILLLNYCFQFMRPQVAPEVVPQCGRSPTFETEHLYGFSGGLSSDI